MRSGNYKSIKERAADEFLLQSGQLIKDRCLWFKGLNHAQTMWFQSRAFLAHINRQSFLHHKPQGPLTPPLQGILLQTWKHTPMFLKDSESEYNFPQTLLWRIPPLVWNRLLTLLSFSRCIFKPCCCLEKAESVKATFSQEDHEVSLLEGRPSNDKHQLNFLHFHRNRSIPSFSLKVKGAIFCESSTDGLSGN